MFSTIYKKLLFIILIIFFNIDTTFSKTDSNFIPCRESCPPAIFQVMSAWLCSFQINVVNFCNKTCNVYEFLMKELALRFNTKVHIPLIQYQVYKFIPAHLRWRKYQNSLLQAVVCVCEPKTAYNHSIAMFFTKNEIMYGRLVKAVSERTIRCCYSSRSSADEIFDFLSSLQFGSITPLVFPDKGSPLDSVKAFILNTCKHQNPNTSNDSSTKSWKEEIKINKRGKCKLYLEKISTTTPDYEYHSEPLRQHRRFVESEVFEEKDSERTEKLIQWLNNNKSQYFTFCTVFFTYRLLKFFLSVLIKPGFLIQFSEDISIQLSKNTIEPSFISSEMLMSAMIISEPTEPSHLKN